MVETYLFGGFFVFGSWATGVIGLIWVAVPPDSCSARAGAFSA